MRVTAVQVSEVVARVGLCVEKGSDEGARCKMHCPVHKRPCTVYDMLIFCSVQCIECGARRRKKVEDAGDSYMPSVQR